VKFGVPEAGSTIKDIALGELLESRIGAINGRNIAQAESGVEDRAQPKKKKKKKKEKRVSRRRGTKINADGVAKSKMRNRGATGPIRSVVQGGLPGLGKNR
jgi:hypothetical protein